MPPPHPSTAAQAAAHGSDGPALIWTRTADADFLASNGLADWFDHHGDRHCVPAAACRRAAAGRADNTTAVRRDVDGWLPLTTRRRRSLANGQADESGGQSERRADAEGP